jgi:hypothetical protein
MNERIKELALQAGEYVNSVYKAPIRSKTPGKIWEDGYAPWDVQFNEKFAELIVRECAHIADLADENKCEWIGGNILTHFGVEELPACKHDWYSAKNPVVQNGSVCVICGAIDAREPEELKNERTN